MSLTSLLIDDILCGDYMLCLVWF